MDKQNKFVWSVVLIFLLLIIVLCMQKLSDCSERNFDLRLMTDRHLGFRKHRHYQSTDFDFLIFTQSWPFSVCSQWMERKKGNKCKFPKTKNAWTIHGLWPSSAHMKGPFFCDKNWHFNMKEILPIKNELIEKWTNVHEETRYDDLWKHEWEKHGTCAAQHIPELGSEYKYFKKGLEFLDTYSITKLLSLSDIQPGVNTTFKVGEINAGLLPWLGNSFAIICERDQITKREYLYEIRICVDKKTLNLRSCEGILIDDEDTKDDITTNCNKDEDIVYASPPWLLQGELTRKDEEQFINNNWLKYVVNTYEMAVQDVDEEESENGDVEDFE
jgi:ribonuclease T2